MFREQFGVLEEETDVSFLSIWLMVKPIVLMSPTLFSILTPIMDVVDFIILCQLGYPLYLLFSV